MFENHWSGPTLHTWLPPHHHHQQIPSSIFLFLKFYLFIHRNTERERKRGKKKERGGEREREREAETQAEGKAGSMQGAWHGTPSRDSRIMPWAKGRCSTIEPPRRPISSYFFFFFFLRFYLFIHRHRGREAETQGEGEAGSMQGAWCGTRSRVSRITTQAEGSTKPLSHPGCPDSSFE